jgi:hypothetical protein
MDFEKLHSNSTDFPVPISRGWFYIRPIYHSRRTRLLFNILSPFVIHDLGAALTPQISHAWSS